MPYGDADALEAELAKAAQVGTPIAGFVVEPVQGEAGGVVPPDDYLPRARELCTALRRAAHRRRDPDRHGPHRRALGRGPHRDRPRHHVPRQVDRRRRHAALGLHLHAEIWEVMIPNPIIHSTTFGGNPMACAAGIAAIEVTLEEDLPGQAAAKGEYPAARARARSRANIPQVLTDAHGKGLLIGMEFPDRRDRVPLRGGAVQARRAGGRHLLQGAHHPDRAGARHSDGAARTRCSPASRTRSGRWRKGCSRSR